jgi:hypothetical protein
MCMCMCMYMCMWVLEKQFVSREQLPFELNVPRMRKGIFDDLAN